MSPLLHMAGPLASSSTTLSDVLDSNLSYSAYQILVDTIRTNGRLASARLAFRALRDAIDANVPELRLRLAVPGLASLCDRGRWLQHFSSVRKLALVLPGANAAGIDTNPDRCLRPFLGTSPESRHRIRELSAPSALLPSHVLLRLLAQLPELQTLKLPGPVQPDDLLAWGGLPTLPRLTTLVPAHWTWIHCLGSRFAPSLRSLTLGGARSRWQRLPRPSDVAAGLARLGGLQEVTLGEGLHFTAPDLLLVLDALPPTVRQCNVQQVLVYVDAEESVAVRCDLEGGALVSFVLTSPQGFGTLADGVTSFLEDALIPCNKLGPQLPRLSLGLDLHANPHQRFSARAVGFLARCDEVRMRGIEAAGGGSARDVGHAFGAAPDELWFDLANNEFVGLRLRRTVDGSSSNSSSGSSSSSGGAGSGSLGPGSSGTGAGGGWEALGATSNGAEAEAGERLADSDEVLRRAAQWVRALEAVCRAMFAFCKADAAAEACGGQAPEQAEADSKLAALMEALAQLRWDPEARVRTMIWARFPLQDEPQLADLAERMECDARRIAGWGGAPTVTAFMAAAIMPPRVRLGFALAQVLQALWDGREEGAPSLGRGELARLDWLLGVLQELRVVVVGLGSTGLSYEGLE